MCGIAGIVGNLGLADSELAVAMSAVLVHRGPDEAMQFANERCALAVRRLAIQDVTDGHQPAFSEDRSVVAVLNGEIYNFEELRTRLTQRGHWLSSASDTETIPHLYEEYGDDFPIHLEGMFSIAVWDDRRSRLVVVRDRIGKKPLFYTVVGGQFRFASEIKAFFADRALRREPDPEALHHFLVLQYVPSPWTAFRGIYPVEPGTRLVVENGRITSGSYWSLTPRPDPAITLAEAAEMSRCGMRRAVGKRMRADVPLGAFLSGGIDSACVVATMAEVSADPVRTFTVGFEAEPQDERGLARKTARALGTDHAEFLVRADVAGLLPVLAWHYDQPMADHAAIPYFAAAREVCGEITVALNGEGGDEAFAGYPRVRDVVARVAPGGGPDGRLAAAYADSVITFPEDLLRDLYAPPMAEATANVSTARFLREQFPPAGDAVSRVLAADYAGRLPGCQLPKVDITTMAASLEARSPMLDHEFIEMAANLPACVKIGPRGAKLALREAFRGVVPDEVLDGVKRGFDMPLESWFRHELRTAMWSLLDSPGSSIRRYFRADGVRTLLHQHESGAMNHSLRILILLSLELWLRTYIDQPPPLSPPTEVRVGDL
jgi:asparagine synthase (glutamine-hydrolysing)